MSRSAFPLDPQQRRLAARDPARLTRGDAAARVMHRAGALLTPLTSRVPWTNLTAGALRHSGFMLPSAPSEVVKPAVREFLTTPVEWYMHLALHASEHDRVPLSAIRVPTAFVAGRWDVLAGTSDLRTAAERIPDACYVELRGSHFLPLEQPQAVHAELLALLDRVGALTRPARAGERGLGRPGTLERVTTRAGATALLTVCLLMGACGADDEDEPGPEVISPDDSTSAETERSASPDEPPPDPPEDPPEPARPEVDTTITDGLTSPWGLAFLPDGDALVSERDTGLVKRVPAAGGEAVPVGEIPEADPSSEGGLLGLAVHPEFPDEPWVYAYYSTPSDNRIVRMAYEDDRLGDQEVLLEGIPVAQIHNGGRLGFGPDGFLYVSTGDASESGTAPDRGSLAGKILRLTPEGGAAPDNPFDSEIYSLGHRNVQGIAWDGEGNLFASEFGQDTWDELNVVSPGDNLGWPTVEGRSDSGGDFVDPLVQWDPDEASPSGIAYAQGSVWMAALAGERLWRIDVTPAGRVRGEPTAFFDGEYGRLRTVETAPDGSLWLVTSNTDGRGEPADADDRILRLTLSPG